jgi:pimeloyl-ACP methyl ester carboxylesterase
VGVLACGAALAGIGACASPAARLDAQAQHSGFSREEMRGTAYRHVVYAVGRADGGRTLDVYIEGDGTPYLTRRTVSPDPTPRRPVMLRLMGRGSRPALYVGRPCYGGLANDPPCTPLDWTLGRFSEPIVDSMAAVIERAGVQLGATTVNLFGHSGGGTLALLLARRVPGVRCVVTLAGNLDPDAWTDLHGYSRLAGSLNPAVLGPLPAQTRQRHYVGDRDRVTPPDLVRRAARRLGAEAVVLAGVSHTRGWEKQWPAIVAGHCGEPASDAQRNANRIPAVISP